MANEDSSSRCFACDLTSSLQPLPGGRLFETTHWVVEHCVGPLGVGTLILKPKRHVLHVWDLTVIELDEMGPLIGSASVVVRRLTDCDQCYVCLWSHGGFAAAHIHYVIQPVSNEMRLRYENAGPSLQVEMFRRGELPANDLVETFCNRARAEFRRGK